MQMCLIRLSGMLTRPERHAYKRMTFAQTACGQLSSSWQGRIAWKHQSCG